MCVNTKLLTLQRLQNDHQNQMGPGVNMATGKAVNVCKYKASDIQETPRESLKPDARWSQYGHWEVRKCV